MVERAGVRRGLLGLACTVSCVVGVAMTWVFAPRLFAELSTPALSAVVALMALPLLLALVCRRERSAQQTLADERQTPAESAPTRMVPVEQIRADAEAVVQRDRRRSVIHEPAATLVPSREPV